MKPKVFVISQPSLRKDGWLPNISGLSKYGEIELLLQPGEDPEQNPRLCLLRLTERLTTFNPDQDYLVWIGGDTLGAVLVGVALADLGFDHVRWLRWQRPGRGDPKRNDISVYHSQYVMFPDPSDTEEDDPYDDQQDDATPVRSSHQSRRTRPEPLDG